MKSTTSLVLSFAVATSPVLAQQTDVDPETLEICVGLEPAADIVAGEPLLEPTFPCVDQNGEVVVDQVALETAIATQVDDGPVEPAELVETPEVTAAPADAETTTEGTATLEVPVEEAAPEENVAEEQPAEPAPEETVTTEVETAPEVAETPETSDADVAVEAEADVAAEAEAEATTEADVAVEATQDEALPESEGMPEGDDAAAVADLPTVTDETPDEAEIAIETVEADEPPAAAAASADADADTTADVQVETLTQDDVRSSSQDFETTATGEAQVEARAGSDSGNDGLSNFEKALLLGLGAAVVGSVLNNGDEVVSNSGDRVIVERDGELVVLKDDDVLLRQPGAEVQTRTFDDGSTRTSVLREDGTQIVTIRGNDGRVLRRARILEDGTQIVLFDDTQASAPVVVTEIPREQEAAVDVDVSRGDTAALRAALLANQNRQFDRSYSLRQIRTISEVRDLAPQVELDTVTFATGSAAIEPSQAEELTSLGIAIVDIIQEDPGQMFLIEGHTDAVGDAGYNLALSDRRAETVALALTEYFGVPPENLITQGYGESILKVPTLRAERENRRAAVRNITSLLR
ncbi:OmpA family protein [Yoonia sp. SDW83-1]|uniref:OmpA family protein n=1 Tax=Yoonia sp. SDW83-1 TaxID=3366945 RepID=UPI00398C2CDC